MTEETTGNGHEPDRRTVKLTLDGRFEKSAVQKLDFTQKLKHSQIRLRPTRTCVVLGRKTDKGLKR